MEKFKFQEKLNGNRITLKKHPLELAQTIFDYVVQDRQRLGKFLPWVDFITKVEDEEKYIKMTHDKWEDCSLFDYGIYNEEDTYIGNIGVHSLVFAHDRAELGYWILGKYEGQGYISEAVQVIERYLFQEGFQRVQIRCSDLNSRSENVPKRCGYVYEGTSRNDAIEKGEYRSTKTFSKLCHEFINQEGRPLIRRARKLDSAGVIIAHRKSIKELCSKDYSTDQISAWADRDFKESVWHELMETNHIWVIDDGKEIQGFCDLSLKNKEIRGLYLTPEVKGKGLGKIMLNKALNLARSRGVKDLKLSSTITAADFYRSQGFVGDTLTSHEIGGKKIECFDMTMQMLD